ncbi:hypothetical protein AMTRI_Chr06g171690 [Amborella trichopoda]
MVQSHASVKPIANHNTAQKNFKSGMRPMLHCDYCYKNGHKKDRCFKLVGYPKRQNKPHAYNVETNACPSISQLTSTVAPQFTTDQHRQLLQLLQVGSLSHSANFSANHCCSAFSPFIDTWIIDSGATDHIICFPSFLSSIEPSSPTNPVKLPNEHITLHNMLCVPSSSYNLLSIQKLTYYLQCSITFFFDYCTFQDRVLRRIESTMTFIYFIHPKMSLHPQLTVRTSWIYGIGA